MHIRTSRVRRNGKTCQYAQLVESYRRPDGMPVHCVVAGLGSLSLEQINNLKLALVAGRQGQQLAIEDEAVSAAPRSPVANLRYLDIAVLVALAGECGLSELLASLLPKGEATVTPADVVLHWGVETAHQILDTAFAEDDHPWIESNRAAFVVSILQRLAYTILALFRRSHSAPTNGGRLRGRHSWATCFSLC